MLAPLHVAVYPVNIMVTILLSERARRHEAIVAQVPQKEGVVVVILTFLQLIQLIIQITTTVHD